MPSTKSRFALAERRGFNIQTDFTTNFSHSQRKFASGTKRAADATAEAFKEFLKRSYKWPDERISEYTSRGAPPFDASVFKNFLTFWAANGKGRLDKKDGYPTADTVYARWKKLTGWLGRETGKEVTRAVLDDVHGYLDTELPKSVPVKMLHTSKDTTDEFDYDVLMNQLWCLDIFIHTNGRDVIQVPLVIHMLYFFGIQRVGAFLATHDYPNLGLRYRDLEILVDRRTDTHEPFLRVKYISDHMKARKEKNDWLGTVQNEQRRFQDCSVFLILVLAFADNAFEHISTPEELLRVQPFEGAPRVIPFHPKVKDQFVLRSRKGNAMTDNVFRNLYRPMVQRAGYKMERMQLYNIRRGVANIVKNHVPGSRLRQVMGHRSDNEFLRFYQTRLVDIDFQGIVLRGEQDSGIDYTRLLRSERGLRPPTELPASVKEGIESCLAGVANGTTEYYSLKKSLTQDAWRQFLKAWNDRIGHSSTGTHPTRTTSTLIPNSCELEGDLMMQETRAKILLRHFCLEFAKISEAFQADAFNIRQDDHLNVMKFLISYVRCKAQQHTFWYPTAFPICTLDDEGNPKYACPICSKDITAFNNPRRRPKHIHRCQQLQKQISDDYEPRHCYRCHLWFSDRTSYRDHCRSHYMHLDMFCGLWRESETVIVAARCPFCLSDHLAGSEWDARVVEFTEARTLQRHLRHHLQALPLAALLPCPHPLCDKAERLSRNDLINHLADSHGLDYDLIKGFRAPNTDVNSSSLEDDCSSKEITSGNEDEPPREISLTSATDLTCGQERVWQHRFGRDHRLQQGLEKAVLEEGQRSPDCATQLSPTDYSSLSFAIPIDVSGPKCGNKRQREVPAASSTESVLSQRHDLSWRKRVRTSRLV